MSNDGNRMIEIKGLGAEQTPAHVSETARGERSFPFAISPEDLSGLNAALSSYLERQSLSATAR